MAQNVPLGIFVTLVSAATVAFAMTLQRYALRVPAGSRVRFLCRDTKAEHVWFVGFLMYFAGNGLQGFSLTLGPLFLMGSVFTSLLLFSVLSAWALLGERPTLMRMVSTLLVVCGVVGIAVAPTQPELSEGPYFNGTTLEEAQQDGAQLMTLFEQPQAIAFLCVVVAFIATSIGSGSPNF